MDLSLTLNLVSININGFSSTFMEQVCDKCGKTVSGVVRVSEPQDLYSYTKNWCFACVYEKGLTDFNKRNRLTV